MLKRLAALLLAMLLLCTSVFADTIEIDQGDISKYSGTGILKQAFFNHLRSLNEKVLYNLSTSNQDHVYKIAVITQM
ncbi:hypothetical protein AGMMS49975_29560 [Clostridia bacterium]|nr:hypothetical protein AGMMS49975_29560 [Clostridia bacterium]